ncbi:MAG: NAD(P)H-dependent oxidoreductase [Alphaproteobacteria bacterium]|nr:NAD(P)H-dependent oxidoreductase [Alphaproteobacteria bacterium]
MTKRVFIWVAHPRSGSLCEGIADAYQAGAGRAGADIRRLNLSEMAFAPEFDGYGDDMPPLEPDLRAWQDGIAWADHLLFVHPYWWGAMPTRAKAVLDRALIPGFGFTYHRKGVAWDKLLSGRTADAIITSDTPPLLDTLLYRKPARRVIRNQVLGFCGIKAKRVVQFGPVKTAPAKRIANWLDRAERMGLTAAA